MQKTLVALALIFATSFAALSDVTITATAPAASATTFWAINGPQNSKIGRFVVDLGDFNGDTYKDYAVAGSGTGTGETVYIILGKQTGRTESLGITSDSAPANNFLTVKTPSGEAITSLAGGDLNGDNIADLVIAVAGSQKVYVVYGSASFTSPYQIATLSGAAGFTVTTIGSTASIAVADVASDNKQDLIIGLTGYASNVGTTTEGGVCVVYGKEALASGASTTSKRGSTVVDCTGDIAKLNTITTGADLLDGTFYKGANGDKAGLAVAAGGDMNGDGKYDIFVSSETSNNAWIIYGAGGLTGTVPTTVSTVKDLSTAGTTTTWLDLVQPANGAITTAAFIGNFNGDANARAELALGYPGFSSSKGKVFVLLARAASLPAADTNIDNTDATIAVSYTGKEAGGYFGYTLDGADVNNDGNSDLIVGAPGATTDLALASATGRVNIIYGATTPASRDLGTTALTSTTGVTLTGIAGSGFGIAVSAAGGDLTNDQVVDFLVGAPLLAKASVTGSGTVYQFAGQKADTTTPSGSGATLSASLLVLASFFVALMF